MQSNNTDGQARPNRTPYGNMVSEACDKRNKSCDRFEAAALAYMKKPTDKNRESVIRTMDDYRKEFDACRVVTEPLRGHLERLKEAG